MQCSSQRNRNRSDCNSMVILRHPSQSRWMSSSRRTTRDPDMRQCNSVEELVQMAYEHLDVLTPRGKSFFWRKLSKLLQNRGRRPSGINHKQGPIEKQLDTILRNTLDGMHAFDYRDIATTALGLAKIVIQVGPSRGKKHTRGNPHQILHDRLIGVKSESKRFIFGEIAISSIPVLPKFEARHLSNLIYAYGLAECIPKMDEGRILPCTQAMSKLRHFNPQDLSNMLWAYAKVGASNPALFKHRETQSLR